MGYARLMAERDRRDEGQREADPFLEPRNSTVHDWLGQRVGRDAELADRLVHDTGGDEQQAERLFDEISEEREQYEESHDQMR
jgi:hypothetical protein